MATHASSSGVDSLVEELGRLQAQFGLAISEVLEQELRFLEMLTRVLRKSEKAGIYSNLLFRFLAKITRCLCMSSNLHSSVTSLYDILIVGEDRRTSEPLNFLQKFDSKIRADCAILLDSLKSISWSVAEILEFVVCLVSNLKRLSNLKVEIFVSVKNQITVLIEKFSLLEIILRFMVKYCTKPQELKDFLDNHVMNWVHDAATLSLLFLLKGKDENMLEILETMLCDILQEIKHCSSTPEVMGMLIVLLKDSKPSRSDKLQAGQTVAALVDFLLESVIDPLKEYVTILRDGLIFMITFYMDPPPEKAVEGRFFRRIDGVVNEVLSHVFSLCIDELKVDISVGGKLCLSSLQYKIDEVKMEIRKLVNMQVSNPSDFNFPAVNSMWFIVSFLENIQEMVKPSTMIAFARHQVLVVQEELLILRPFLKDIMELKKEKKDLTDLWNRIMNTVFLAEYAIASCSFLDHPIWYDMLWLSDVIQAIKLVMCEVKKRNGQIYNAKMTSTNTSSTEVPMKQANPLSLQQDDVVGMEDESEKIIDKLRRGTKQLDIVSIVGMAGLGKTTLAKKVYNDRSVICYFHQRAWCCVSQVCNIRELYFDILTDVTGVEARKSYSNDSDNDLAEKLWKSLKGRRYLVVFDDIWSIEAWNSMKGSLPDDRNGSRIMFTSRIHNLLSEAKLKCSPHLLRALSNEESQELFKKKLSQRDSSPPNDIGEIAKNIVENCQGVPLAVVLVAGVLAGTNIEFWKEVEKSTVPGVVGGGCRDVVELSYKHLPDNLKPCFLYFGAFPGGKVISSEKLMNLWIGEGFVSRSDKKSAYKEAETYLSDLIGRSLVIIAERSSSGGIKKCRVHDLLLDMCLVKIEEENFLQVVPKNGVSESSLNHLKGYDSYRLCTGIRWLHSPFIERGSPFVRSIVGFFDDFSREFKSLHVSLIEHFKLLRVLDLAEIRREIDFVGAGISFMVHLRYLSVNGFLGNNIPESIANLWNLETLIVEYIRNCSLPSTFWKMKSLRHVNICTISVSGIESYEYSELEHMETLADVEIGSRDELKELSRRLPGLRRLKCLILFWDNLEFSCFTNLETLDLDVDIDSARVERQVMPTFDFPNNLKNLTLRGNYNLPRGAISIIGGLPNLEFLKLTGIAFEGREWQIVDGEFLKLKVLELLKVNIERWTIPEEYNDPFPSLERLILSYCPELQKIPSSFGYIPTLKTIKLVDCSEAAEASAMEILQEQEEMGIDGLRVSIVCTAETREKIKVLLMVRMAALRFTDRT